MGSAIHFIYSKCKICYKIRGGRKVLNCEFIPSYTEHMKTAISIPDNTFESATKRAALLGISRSEFFTRAVKRYLDELDAESITSQINRVVDLLNADESSLSAVAAGRRTLINSDDHW